MANNSVYPRNRNGPDRGYNGHDDGWYDNRFKSWMIAQLTLPNIVMIISIIVGAAVAHNRLANAEAIIMDLKREIPATYERIDRMDERFKRWESQANILLRAIERLDDRIDRNATPNRQQ